MKKSLAALTILAGIMIASVGRLTASDVVLPSSSIVNQVLVPTQTVDLDLNQYHADLASVQVVYSSANPSAINFGDGTAGSGSIQVVNSALTSLTTAYATEKITVTTNGGGTKAHGEITIISTTGLSGIALTVNGHSFAEGAAWTGIGSGVTTSTAATNLARVLNASSATTHINAAAAGAVVFTTATTVGLLGNEYTMSSGDVSVMKASSTLVGGLDTALHNRYITVNAGGRSVVLMEGANWFEAAVASNTAISINTALLNAFGSVFTSTVHAGSAIIYSTSVAYGSASNAWTVSASTVALTVDAATFTGGQDNAVIKIANFPLTANTDWTVGATSITAARSISAAINSKLGSILISTHTQGIVFATATIVGIQTNYAMSVSTPSALTLSGALMTGGADSSITLSTAPSLWSGIFNIPLFFPGSGYGVTNTIVKPPTSLGTGSQLLFSTTSGTAPGGLVAQTTYYASNLTSTSFQLADTSTGAVAGVSIAITTTTRAGGGSFRLTPLALNGSPVIKIQKSNDDTNFQDIYVSTNQLVAPFAASVTFASPYTASNQVWDLGDVNYRWLRLSYTGATAGGTNVRCVVNGKRK